MTINITTNRQGVGGWVKFNVAFIQTNMRERIDTLYTNLCLIFMRAAQEYENEKIKNIYTAVG